MENKHRSNPLNRIFREGLEYRVVQVTPTNSGNDRELITTFLYREEAERYCDERQPKMKMGWLEIYRLDRNNLGFQLWCSYENLVETQRGG